jgi:transposase
VHLSTLFAWREEEEDFFFRKSYIKQFHEKRIAGKYSLRIICSSHTLHYAAHKRTGERPNTENCLFPPFFRPTFCRQRKLTGQYFLRTNLVEMGPKELWQLYNTIRGVEDAFRFMKSSLGLRPVYHQKEHRVDGHLWITVLAYHLIQNCLYQLNKREIHYQWKTVRKVMMSRIRVTIQAKTEDGKTLYHRSTTKAEGEQVNIYKALGLSFKILKAQRTIL